MNLIKINPYLSLKTRIVIAQNNDMKIVTCQIGMVFLMMKKIHK